MAVAGNVLCVTTMRWQCGLGAVTAAALTVAMRWQRGLGAATVAALTVTAMRWQCDGAARPRCCDGSCVDCDGNAMAMRWQRGLGTAVAAWQSQSQCGLGAVTAAAAMRWQSLAMCSV